ncbi:MAG: hypothetical protein ACKOFW_16860, partial [Planctomycetaceae bacterium]
MNPFFKLLGRVVDDLRDARLEKRADRSFLVGTALDAEGWTRGLKIEVAWDKVDSLVVYDSAEQFEERI